MPKHIAKLEKGVIQFECYTLLEAHDILEHNGNRYRIFKMDSSNGSPYTYWARLIPK